jgi:hypothetical protein
MTTEQNNTKPKPDDTGNVRMEGHVLITDKQTGEVLVDKKNAIHFGNMAFVIATAMIQVSIIWDLVMVVLMYYQLVL